MSTARAPARPNGKPAAAKARQAPPPRPRAAPEKTRRVGKSADAKPPRENLGNAGKGRVKGVPNAVTKTAREIFTAFVEGNAAKLQELFDRVARKNPAKALAIYAKLAEFVIPKLQRTELSGELNQHHHGLAYTGPVELVSDHVEASRVYQEIIMGKRDGRSIAFAPKAESVAAELSYKEMVEDGKRQWNEQHPAPPAAALPEPAPERLRPPESAPEAEPAEPSAEANVVILEPVHQGEHQPVVDSKCAFCRQLWARQEELTKDKALRHQRPWVIT